ncbi:MAG: hypothetical protein Ct9H300mP21_05660 [Pseudomonadota bacterium]|nr:MAG: hypothetical protein Ct9H300mP21_05660 [Pseudomonadota bacterium]
MLNFFNQWKLPFSTKKSQKQAFLAFKGDVFSGLDASALSEKPFGLYPVASAHFSGLYGLLRPLDLMQPYRLEMGLKLTTKKKGKFVSILG